jgi:streptomycin 3"-adenylyltransferase
MTETDDATAAQIDKVTGMVRDLLGGDLIAAYLFGSAVEGGLKPSSDVDLLVVGRRATTAETRRRLIQRLLPISSRHAAAGPARPIELTIAVQSDIRPWRYPPRLDFQYGDWWRPEFERGELEPWTSPNPDLTILLQKVIQGSRTLVGPSPATILDPIPPADLDRAMLDTVPELLPGLVDDTRNSVLTLARIWVTRATGEIVAKEVAADWALARLPPAHRPVLAHARSIYVGDVAETWSDDLKARVDPFADHVIAELRAARGHRATAPDGS